MIEGIGAPMPSIELSGAFYADTAAAHRLGKPHEVLRRYFRKRQTESPAIKPDELHCSFYGYGIGFDEKVGKQARVFKIKLLRLLEITVKAERAQLCYRGGDYV